MGLPFPVYNSSTWVSQETSGTRGGRLVVVKHLYVRRENMSWVVQQHKLSWDLNVSIQYVHVVVIRNTELYVLILETLHGVLELKLAKLVSLMLCTTLATMNWFVRRPL